MPWTRPFHHVGKAGESLLDRLLCVVGAVLFSQAPEFMQQYLQRLGGHLDEARLQVQKFAGAAAEAGKSVDAMIASARASADPAIAKLGGVVAAASDRASDLAAAEHAIRDASPFTRPFVFLRHMDTDIASATWGVFKPAVPTTLEGALYAAAGMVVFLLLYHGLVRKPAVAAWTRIRRPAKSVSLPKKSLAR